MRWVADDAPELKHSGVYRWREQVAPLIGGADAVVTTSQTVRDVHLRAFPNLPDDAVTLIEHGRDLEWTPVPVDPPTPGGEVRLLLPGNLGVHKGTGYVREMLRADSSGRLSVHMLGRVSAGNEDLGTYHGTYDRDEYAHRVASIAPHFIGVLSTTAESYSHTLSESLMTGVPIAATDIGAVGERVHEVGGGVLLPVDDPAAGLRRLLAAADDTDGWSGLGLTEKAGVRPVSDMVDDYDQLYRQVIAERRSVRYPGPARLRVVVVTPGRGTAAPASSHVRLLRALGHPTVADDVAVRHVPVEDLRDVTDADVVVVHRTALEDVDHVAVLEALAGRGIPVVVDIDDLLFDPEQLPTASDRDWRPAVDALRATMQAAVFVTVSTEPLRAAASELVDDVRIVPNAIDERLWFAPATAAMVPGAAPAPGGHDRSPLRVLYMGSRTHGADLDLLRPALERLNAASGPGVHLGVVGGEVDARTWYESIPIPASRYDRFVPWVRSVAATYDVGAAPLVDDRFNASKSDLKWLDYTALGLATVVSDVPGYQSVTDGETGLVVPSDPDRWVEALRTLHDPERRRSLHAAALEEVLAGRTLARTAFRWISLLREAAGAAIIATPAEVA